MDVNAVCLGDHDAEGTEKETYLSEGDTLTISLPIASLDDIDFFGIRATSTTTDAGSIKAVSGDPECPEEPEDPLHDKVFFDFGANEEGVWNGGIYIQSEEPVPNVFNVPALPEGTEPTFDNYLGYFEEIGGDIASVDSVSFFDVDDEGVLRVSLTLDAPEGGFADAAAVQEAYDAAIAEQEAAGAAAPEPDLLAALSLDVAPEEDYADDEELELI